MNLRYIRLAKRSAQPLTQIIGAIGLLFLALWLFAAWAERIGLPTPYLLRSCLTDCGLHIPLEEEPPIEEEPEPPPEPEQEHERKDNIEQPEFPSAVEANFESPLRVDL